MKELQIGKEYTDRQGITWKIIEVNNGQRIAPVTAGRWDGKHYVTRTFQTNGQYFPDHADKWDLLVEDYDYTENDKPNAHVGYLRQGHFICLFCNDAYASEPDAKVYLVNIAPYKQTCHDCNRLVVQGRTSAWCNAFD